jgi:Flp pilus assembly CpaE family ATPase
LRTGQTGVPVARDARSFRVALVADRYVNPPPDGTDGLAVAADAGWGVLQLPAEDYPASLAGPLLAEVAEQAEEFRRHGNDLVLVGERDGLAEALAQVGLALPDSIVPGNAAELSSFLSARPAPAAIGPSGPVR